MPNADRPRGARAVRHLDGSPYNGATNKYAVDVSNATAIFPGDFVIREDDGNVAPYTGTSGGNVLGVCASVQADPDNLSRRYLAATTAGTVLIADAPDLIFEIQEDDVDGSALTAAAAGANCDVLATAGSTTTGQSAHEIDRSTILAANGQLRLLRIVEREDNDYGDAAAWEVAINEHTYKSVAGTGTEA